MGLVVDQKTVERFNSRSKINEKTGCTEWQTSFLRNGYGSFSIKDKTYSAHRISWIINKGEVPKGLCVLHRCDNGSCVNPNHLFLGTNKDNTADMMKKGRSNNNGEKHWKSKLTEKQVRFILRSKLSQKEKAKMFNVHQTTISYIMIRQTWRHVNP